MTTQLSYTPTQELIEFADDFSKNCKSYGTGTYLSKDKTYTLEFKHKLENYPNSLAKTRIKDGLFQLAKDFLIEHDLHPDLVFYTIIWMDAMWQHEDTAKADMVATQYILTTNKSYKDILKGMAVVFMQSGSSSNQERFKQIFNKLLP